MSNNCNRGKVFFCLTCQHDRVLLLHLRAIFWSALPCVQILGDKWAKRSVRWFSDLLVATPASWPLYTASVLKQRSLQGKEQSEHLCVQIASSLVIITCAPSCMWPWPSLRKVQPTSFTSLCHCRRKNRDETELMWTMCKYSEKPHSKDSHCELVVSRHWDFFIFFCCVIHILKFA